MLVRHLRDGSSLDCSGTLERWAGVLFAFEVARHFVWAEEMEQNVWSVEWVEAVAVSVAVAAVVSTAFASIIEECHSMWCPFVSAVVFERFAQHFVRSFLPFASAAATSIYTFRQQ